jgi:histidine triad (HIT) family protein
VAGAAQPDCVFCRIAAGQIPSSRVYEDDRVFAFLDISPLARGHTLVIPKSHAVRFDELDADTAAALAEAVRQLAPRVITAVGGDDYNILNNNGASAGQVVRHVHVHIIPRREGDGLGYRWNAGKATPEELADLAARIAKP